MTDREILEKIYRSRRIMLNEKGKKRSNGHTV